MAETAEVRDDKLELARSLVAHLEQGDASAAGLVVAELAGFAESQLFHEVGRLTRELHDSIKRFGIEARLADIAENEMPNAAERLRYVITTTEQAAHTTLGAVEDSLPLADALRSDAHQLAEQWERFSARRPAVEDFRALSATLSQFLQVTQANAEELHNKLSEVLMAQGYQDLTGQVIRNVIDLVDDVEHKLVELLRLSGSRPVKPVSTAETSRATVVAHGPTVPGIQSGNEVASQDEVDELLSSLGF